MLSRVANNLFWLDRYMERAYGRLLLMKVGNMASQDTDYDYKLDPVYRSFLQDEKLALQSSSSSDALKTALFNQESDQSIFNIIFKARENARSAQEHLSKELWLNINKYYLFLKEKAGNDWQGSDPAELIDELIRFNMLYFGVADITQERGSAFSFMNNGKYTERLLQSVEFLENNLLKTRDKKNPLAESVYWKNLLLCIGGYQIYLKTYKSAFEREHVIELMMTNPRFPRSVRYGLSKLKTHIMRLQDLNRERENELTFHMGKLESEIRYMDMDTLLNGDMNDFLTKLKQDIYRIHQLFDRQYFSNH